MLYTTFWQRLGACLLDFACYGPFLAIFAFVGSLGRNFYIGYAAPDLLIGLWFHVYLVKRFGGTPGKLMMGLRIVRANGSPVGYREAFLRQFVELSLSLLASLGLIMGTLRMTSSEYLSLGWLHRITAQANLAPGWYPWVSYLSEIWTFGLLIVMLANTKRRATHDFIAGTVVVNQSPNQQGFSATDPTRIAL